VIGAPVGALSTITPLYTCPGTHKVIRYHKCCQSNYTWTCLVQYIYFLDAVLAYYNAVPNFEQNCIRLTFFSPHQIPRPSREHNNSNTTFNRTMNQHDLPLTNIYFVTLYLQHNQVEESTFEKDPAPL
jgi:hypothetical protein